MEALIVECVFQHWLGQISRQELDCNYFAYILWLDPGSHSSEQQSKPARASEPGSESDDDPDNESQTVSHDT